VCEVGRVFPRHVQSTCLTGESPLDCPRVARTLRLYNYLLRFHLTIEERYDAIVKAKGWHTRF